MNMEGMATTWAHSVMLAAATGTNAPAASPAAGGSLPLNGFDFLLVVTLIIGLMRGRKRGMSLELLDVLEWLLIVVVCPLYYLLGNFFALKTGLPLMYSYMICFGFLAMAIKAIFTTFKVKAGEKVIGSDLFGGWEYYLGMAAGMIRFSCMLLVVLALLHAIPLPSEAEVKAEIARRKKANDGMENFPPFGQVQLGIFKNSFTGPLIKEHLKYQLIVPTNPNLKAGQAGAPDTAKKK